MSRDRFGWAGGGTSDRAGNGNTLILVRHRSGTFGGLGKRFSLLLFVRIVAPPLQFPLLGPFRFGDSPHDHVLVPAVQVIRALNLLLLFLLLGRPRSIGRRLDFGRRLSIQSCSICRLLFPYPQTIVFFLLLPTVREHTFAGPLVGLFALQRLLFETLGEIGVAGGGSILGFNSDFGDNGLGPMRLSRQGSIIIEFNDHSLGKDGTNRLLGVGWLGRSSRGSRRLGILSRFILGSGAKIIKISQGKGRRAMSLNPRFGFGPVHGEEILHGSYLGY